ncbi:translation initiation factor SUI1 [Phyllosticta citricarpa]
MSTIENLRTFDPFAEADEDTGETKQSQNYIHIRIQQRNGRKTLTTVQGLPKKFDQKKILKVIKKKFACNGTIVHDSEMGEVIQLQGDQRKDVQEFLTDKKEGLELDAKTIKVRLLNLNNRRRQLIATRSTVSKHPPARPVRHRDRLQDTSRLVGTREPRANPLLSQL